MSFSVVTRYVVKYLDYGGKGNVGYEGGGLSFPDARIFKTVAAAQKSTAVKYWGGVIVPVVIEMTEEKT